MRGGLGPSCSGRPPDHGDQASKWTACFHHGYLLSACPASRGPTLSRDAGVVTVTSTFRPLGGDEFDLVSQTFSGEHGPHPDLESGFEVFCDVLIPALT